MEAFATLLLLLLLRRASYSAMANPADASEDGEVESFWSAPSQPLGLNSTYSLAQSINMPVMGFGVHQSAPGPETYNAVRWALEAGYRLLDTAAVYGNEADVGRAMRDSGVPREEIFLTTKLGGDDHGYDAALRAFEASRRRLNVDYVDLYLIHSPYGGRLVETWDALLSLRERGLIRTAGVSNFNVEHIRVLADHGRPLPAVNQIEMHPLVYRERLSLMRWCRERYILIQAYGSMLFGRTDRLGEQPLAGIARDAGRTAAQILLRWGIQHRFQVIPKSVQEGRIRQNIEAFDFELSGEQMEALDRWDGAPLGVYWNPLDAEVDVGDTHRWGSADGNGMARGVGDEETEL